MSYERDERGYARLWATILALTVNDIRLYARRHEVDLNDTENIKSVDVSRGVTWIMNDGLHPGGFLWVCDVLDLLPEYVRSKVLDGGLKYTLSPAKAAQRVKDAAVKRARRKEKLK